MSQDVSVAKFGALPDGRPVEAFILTNSHGLHARILNLGGIVQSLWTPDRDGRFTNIVLGYSDLAGYLADRSYQGALIGRYANRLAGGVVTVDGRPFTLSANEGTTTLHGGARGFDKTLWNVLARDPGASQLRLGHVSPDGDQGFPGALSVEAVYELTDDNALRIEFTASTTAATPISLTSHIYWNLTGDRTETIRGHRLEVEAQAFTPVDEALIPTGEIRPVGGGAFDLRRPRVLGDVIDAADPQITKAHGLDHNFVLPPRPDGEVRRAAILADPNSGRSLEVWTSAPGLQVYTGNFLEDGGPGKAGPPFQRWSGVALETQAFPNAPNCPAFPSAMLQPGRIWRSTTLFRFRPPT